MERLTIKQNDNFLEKELKIKEYTPYEMFILRPMPHFFKLIPKRYQTKELVEYAIEKNGENIRYVSKKLITYDLCKKAVFQNGYALSYIPKELINEELCSISVKSKGRAIMDVPTEFLSKELCEIAVKTDGEALEYIPKRFYTKSLCKFALENNIESIKFIPERFLNKEMILKVVKKDSMLLEYISDNKIDEDIIDEALNCNPLSIQFINFKKLNEDKYLHAIKLNSQVLEWIPKKYRNKEFYSKAFNLNFTSIEYIPIEFITFEMSKRAYSLDKYCIKWIPYEDISLEMCLDAIDYFFNEDQEKNIDLWDIPYSCRNNKKFIDRLLEKQNPNKLIRWHERNFESYVDIDREDIPFSEKNYEYLKKKVQKNNSLEEYLNPVAAILENTNRNEIVPKNCSFHYLEEVNYENDNFIYYISDIHLEFQFKSMRTKNPNFRDIVKFLDYKIDQMVDGIDSGGKILLVGGDVSHSVFLTKLFYSRLSLKWYGKIICVLGNHELWNGHPNGYSNEDVPSVDQIIDEYKNKDFYEKAGVIAPTLLQNSLYIIYKNKERRVVSEDLILKASDEDLKDLCNKSSLLILGGIGFSGNNPKYNADAGLYRSAVKDLKEDRFLTDKFLKVYSKVERCAKNRQVIVLTHTPYSDWLQGSCNLNWIYINGHTHSNMFVKEKGSPIILADNQIGYKPQKWTLHQFSKVNWYDPFSELEDGIYPITSELYADFNIGRGIYSNGCNYEGEILALKKGKIYMFLLKTEKTLCMLNGGQRLKLNNDVNYYYENMDKYSYKIQQLMKPYHDVMNAISEEVRKFGGYGFIHGCIVDISFYSHIYLNPYDGKLSFYNAEDIMSRTSYEDIYHLLNENEPKNLVKKYLKLCKEKDLRILHKDNFISTQKDFSLEKIPELIIGTEIYNPSRKMRQIQYIFENNVIRVWNDKILDYEIEHDNRLENKKLIEE